MRKFFVSIILFYLRFFAKLQLSKINPTIIGVGGGSGKSSTSNIIAQILKSKYKILESKGKNSETGIPLNILGIEIERYSFSEWLKIIFLVPIKFIANNNKYDYFVIEMGIDSPFPPKNMEYLLRFIKPNIGVLTNIVLEHSIYFESLARSIDERDRKKEILRMTAKEEGLLLKSVPEKGLSVVNIDDQNIKSLLPLKSNTISVSTKNKEADFYVKKIEVTEKSFEMTFKFLKEEYTLKINQPLPSYFATSFLLAFAVCFYCGIKVQDAISVIASSFQLPPGRFSVFKGIKNTLIFDSTYNSSLESTIGGMELLKDLKTGRRKVGILGDMRELGGLSQIQHEELAKYIVKNLDFAILIGPMMSQFTAPILKSSNFNFLSFNDFKNAKSEIENNIKKDDLILVKASQNTLFLERVVDMLLENPEDKKLLARRGSFWDKQRRNSN